MRGARERVVGGDLGVSRLGLNLLSTLTASVNLAQYPLSPFWLKPLESQATEPFIFLLVQVLTTRDA